MDSSLYQDGLHDFISYFWYTKVEIGPTDGAQGFKLNVPVIRHSNRGRVRLNPPVYNLYDSRYRNSVRSHLLEV